MDVEMLEFDPKWWVAYKQMSNSINDDKNVAVTQSGSKRRVVFRDAQAVHSLPAHSKPLTELRRAREPVYLTGTSSLHACGREITMSGILLGMQARLVRRLKPLV